MPHCPPAAVELPSGDALDFFRAQRAAFAQRVAALRERPGADLAAALVSEACDSFDRNLAVQGEAQPEVACGKGCATCCTLRVTASAPELLLIARFVRATAPVYARAGLDLVAGLREADAATRGLDETLRVALRRRCPFIAAGACTIYNVRPLACRGHASLDARACIDAAAGRRDEVPFSAPHRLVRSLVQAALLSALRDAGLPWGLAEVNEGVVALLDSGRDDDAAWRDGADVLAQAGLPEAEQREWAALIDAFEAG